MTMMRDSRLFRIAATTRCLLLVFAGALLLKAGTCPPLSQPTKNELAAYVQSRYKWPAAYPTQIAEESFVDETCYRKLRFTSTSPQHPDVVLYLSADQRFLSPALFDRRQDPAEEERKKYSDLNASLTKGNFPSKGPPGAPITIVEFSDFQCPFCKSAAKLISEQMKSDKRIRLVYRHFPLSNHPWARPAASAATCAQFQSNDAFWKLHDFFFANQESLTVDNLRDRVIAAVSQVPSFNVKDFQNCVDNDMALGLVLRETNAATANQVKGTPTLFINGRVQAGFRDAEGLRDLIDAVASDIRRGKRHSRTSPQGTMRWECPATR